MSHRAPQSLILMLGLCGLLTSSKPPASRVAATGTGKSSKTWNGVSMEENVVVETVQKTPSRDDENTNIPYRRICYSTAHKTGWHHMLLTDESWHESAHYIVCTKFSFAPSNLVWEDALLRGMIMPTEFPSHQHTVHCPVPNNFSTSDQSVILPSMGSPVEDHGVSNSCIL